MRGLLLAAATLVAAVFVWQGRERSSALPTSMKYCRVLFGPEAEVELLFAANSERMLLYRSGSLDSSSE